MNVQGVFIARNKLKEQQEGMSERTILGMIETLKHPNIVTFPSSYIQCGVKISLFPYIPNGFHATFNSGQHMEASDVYFGKYWYSTCSTQDPSLFSWRWNCGN